MVKKNSMKATSEKSTQILKYRITNYRKRRNVRGIRKRDCTRCHLVKDDVAVAGKYHFPCIIYLREGGDPIGKLKENYRKTRIKWSATHNTHTDPICSKNCLDVCVDYNNKAEKYKSSKT